MADLDPYRELGLDRDASQADVKRSYRSRAKRAHPDAGGSSAAFDRLQRSYLVLSDPERRGRYDRTGRIEEPGADNETAVLLQRLHQMLDLAIASCLQRGVDPACAALVDEMRAVAARARGEVEKQRATVEKALTAYRRLTGRFRVRKRGAANHMERLLEGKIEMQVQALARFRAEIDAISRAEAALGDYLFDADARPPTWFFNTVTTTST